MQTRSIAAAVLVLSGASLVAQQAAPPQTPTFRTGVELVTVDVNVIDRQGLPLRGLEPSDFTVTVAGQPRRVVSAEYVDVTAAQAAMAVRREGAVSTNEGAAVGRQFVFVVDQSTLETGNARHVARAASSFFNRLTFADRSALMLLPVGQNIEFTWAHDRVRDGLQRVAGMSLPMSTWEYGSLAEARDIANHNSFALRTVASRECGSSARASLLSAAAGSRLGGRPVRQRPDRRRHPAGVVVAVAVVAAGKVAAVRRAAVVLAAPELVAAPAQAVVVELAAVVVVERAAAVAPLVSARTPALETCRCRPSRRGAGRR